MERKPSDIRQPEAKRFSSVHGNPMQAIQYAYLAGIMDGEGTIRIDKMKPRKDRQTINPTYAVHISIGMVDSTIPALLHQTFGVGSRRIECVFEKRPIYRWHVRGNVSARKVIIPLLPYLIIKRPQAELALRLIDGWEVPRAKKLGLSPWELRRREDLYQAVRKLNAVGAAAETKRISAREGEAIVRPWLKNQEGNPKRFPRLVQEN